LKIDNRLYETQHTLKVAATEIILSSQYLDLSNKYEKTVAALNEKSALIEKLFGKVHDLEKKLTWSEEMRHDQVSRSRQSEYRSLSKLEDTSIRYYKALDDKEIIENSLQIQATRGDLIQYQLNTTTAEFDKTQQIFGDIVDAAEHSVAESKKNELRLVAENRALELQLDLNKAALKKVVSTHRKAFQTTPFDRSISQLMDRPRSKSSSSKVRGLKSANLGLLSATLSSLPSPLKTSSSTIDLFPHSHTLSHTAPSSSPLTHTLGSTGSPFPRDAQTARVNRLEDSLLTDTQSLKRSFLTKYFQLLLTSDFQGASRRLDLSQCDLCDADFLKAIEWLRLVRLGGVESLDLKHNGLTGSSLGALITWLVSLAPADTQRSAPLLLDLKYNLVGRLNRFTQAVRALVSSANS